MDKIKFLKNNQEEFINEEEINYLKDQLIIQKKTKDIEIMLDFLNLKCTLKLTKEAFEIDVPVLLMTHQKDQKCTIFEYTLTSEPETKNTIIITTK